MDSNFKRVARELRVEPELLRDAILATDDGGRRQVTLSVRKPKYVSVVVHEGTRLWRVAEYLNMEPEDLRDVIIDAHPAQAPGRTLTLSAFRSVNR